METISTSAPEIVIDSLDPLSEVHEDGSSKGKPTDKASQDVLRPTEADEEGTSKGPETDEKGRPVTLYGDFLRLAGITKPPVEPTAVVIEKYRQLFEATLKGNWKGAKKILYEDRETIEAEVMTVGNRRFTVLDVAIMAAQDQLVENLIKHFPREKNVLIFALNSAARRGRIRMVKALVDEIDRHTTSDKADFTKLPLEMATIHAPMQKEVIWYLARRTTSNPDYSTLFSLICAGYLDIALCLVRRSPSSAVNMDKVYVNILKDLGTMKFCFLSEAGLNFWENCIYKCIPLSLVDTFDICQDKEIDPVGVALNSLKKSLWNLATIAVPFIKRIGEVKLMHSCSLKFASLALEENKNLMGTMEVLKFLLTSGIVLDAASHGKTEIVNLCLEHFPELMWEEDFTTQLIRKVVNGRHVELFRVVNAHNKTAKLSDNRYMSHVLMKEFVQRPPGRTSVDVSGAAVLIQREIQWYKVLEDRIEPFYKCRRMVNKKTYREVFVETEKRQDLVKEAGQWIKQTSSSCSLVAVLIVTVAFAAAFTVPGGNDGRMGIPIFLKKGSFVVFAVADAFALFSSVTATLMFLAILSSRYALEDFLLSLPRKMILGLTFLFLSLVFMLVAFSSALTIILSERFKWIYIPITLLAAFPVILFAILHFPLYVEMVQSTCRPLLYRPLKLWK